jgi:HrpA-like RNA helicase
MKTPPQSKKKTKEKNKKIKQLQDKKIKIQRREGNIEDLKRYSLDPSFTQALLTSKNLGSSQSLRSKLKTELQKEKLGLRPNGILYNEKTIENEDYVPSKSTKVPIYKPIKIIPASPSSDSVESPIPSIQAPKAPPRAVEALSLSHTDYVPVPIPDLNPLSLMGYTDEAAATPSACIQDFKKELPIAHMEQEIIETIRYNPVLLICGETGSGKSTQLPQYLLQNGFTVTGKIGITQPRRIAAITLAQRVAFEAQLALGKEIGYQVRYDSTNVSKENLIKFMTDGILLKEIASDFVLSQYNVIIIDEAHERGVNTDILLGLLSRILPLRRKMAEDGKISELKLVIMSASLRVQDFTENTTLFCESPPVIKIDSRQFPVTIHFSKSTDTSNYIDQIVQKTQKIHKNLPPGGILIFVPGKKEVLSIKSLLKSVLSPRETQISGLYSMLSLKKQLKIFKPPENKRLIVISTNVAETSITIPNIVYVIDSGLEKKKIYSNSLQMSKFVITYISRSSALQRSGRAGRTSPGHCYRLYSNAAFANAFVEFREPDICNHPLSPIILQLKALGIKNVLKFPFPTVPAPGLLNDSLSLLKDLGALVQYKKGDGDVYKITDLGKAMAEVPIAPRYSKMLIYSKGFHVHPWMCVVVAGMEIEQIFDMDKGNNHKKDTANAKKVHARWFTGSSDCLNVLKMFLKFARTGNTQKFSEKYKVIEKSLIEVQKLSVQLMNIITETKTHNLSSFLLPYPTPNQELMILKSLVSGFIDQIALKVDLPDIVSKRVPYSIQNHLDCSLIPKDYKSSHSNPDYAYIHPSSYFYKRSPPSIIAYQSLSFVTRPSLFNVTEVRNEWVYELGSSLVHDIKPLQGAEAFYEPKHDGVYTWVTAAYGKKMWAMPPAYSEFPESETKYFWFARLLLEGKVLLSDEIFWKYWKINIKKSTDKGMIKIQKILFKHNIDSVKALKGAIQKNPDFLVNDLVSIAKDEYKDKIKAIWKLSGFI